MRYGSVVNGIPYSCIDIAHVIKHEDPVIYRGQSGTVGIFYLVQADGAGDGHVGGCVVMPQKAKIIVLCGFRPIAIELDLGGCCVDGCADTADQPCYTCDQTVDLVGIQFLKNAVTEEDDWYDRKVRGRGIELQGGDRCRRGVGLSRRYSV
jgi:hypothetical protein